MAGQSKTRDGSGKVGQGLTRTGSQAPITLPTNSASLSITNTITIEAWVNVPSNDAGYHHIFDSDGAYSLSIQDGRPAFYTGSSGGWWAPTNFPVLSLNTWHYVVATYDSSQKVIYIDGAQVASTPTSGASCCGGGQFAA